LPVLALSDDMPDRKAEKDRAERAYRELKPLAIVVSGTYTKDTAGAKTPSGLPADCMVIQAAELSQLADDAAAGKHVEW
jgi:hypothetical protein